MPPERKTAGMRASSWSAERAAGRVHGKFRPEFYRLQDPLERGVAHACSDREVAFVRGADEREPPRVPLVVGLRRVEEREIAPLARLVRESLRLFEMKRHRLEGDFLPALQLDCVNCHRVHASVLWIGVTRSLFAGACSSLSCRGRLREQKPSVRPSPPTSETLRGTHSRFRPTAPQRPRRCPPRTGR